MTNLGAFGIGFKKWFFPAFRPGAVLTNEPLNIGFDRYPFGLGLLLDLYFELRGDGNRHGATRCSIIVTFSTPPSS